MFCVDCGHILREGSKFCPQCGRPLSDPQRLSAENESLSITVALNKNINLVQTAPYILRLERNKCGLIKIEPDFYMQIIRFSSREKEKESAFREFAAGLNLKSTDELISGFPGSIGFENVQILSLHIETYYDGSLHRYMDYDRFTLKTVRDQYKGSISSDACIMSYKNILQILLGNRFTGHETIHSFD